MLDTPRARARVEGQGRGRRAPRRAAPHRDEHLRAAARDPAPAVRARAASVKRRISRRALFARDGWRCVYCGDGTTRLTLDHVVPRSRGGDSVWENVVTACGPCNLRKGDRLLEETQCTSPAAARAVAGAVHQPRAPPRARRLAAVPPGDRGATGVRARPARGRCLTVGCPSAAASGFLHGLRCDGLPALVPVGAVRAEHAQPAVSARISPSAAATSSSSGWPPRTQSKR